MIQMVHLYLGLTESPTCQELSILSCFRGYWYHRGCGVYTRGTRSSRVIGTIGVHGEIFLYSRSSSRYSSLILSPRVRRMLRVPAETPESSCKISVRLFDVFDTVVTFTEVFETTDSIGSFHILGGSS